MEERSSADGTTVILAETGMVGWDYREGKIRPLHKAVRKELALP